MCSAVFSSPWKRPRRQERRSVRCRISEQQPQFALAWPKHDILREEDQSPIVNESSVPGAARQFRATALRRLFVAMDLQDPHSRWRLCAALDPRLPSAHLQRTSPSTRSISSSSRLRRQMSRRSWSTCATLSVMNTAVSTVSRCKILQGAAGSRLRLVRDGCEHDGGVAVVVAGAGVLSAMRQSPANAVELLILDCGEELRPPVLTVPATRGHFSPTSCFFSRRGSHAGNEQCGKGVASFPAIAVPG